jgi:hypothetical protein
VQALFIRLHQRVSLLVVNSVWTGVACCNISMPFILWPGVGNAPFSLIFFVYRGMISIIVYLYLFSIWDLSFYMFLKF